MKSIMKNRTMKNVPMRNITIIISILKKQFPKQFFKQSSPFYVLISTVLSQRTRDENTIKASKELFARFDTPEKLANANLSAVEILIKKSGFYRVKAKRIKEISRILLQKHNGKVPDNEQELLALPGVGRKTANIVLSFSFNKNVIAVDTHLHRIPNRIGLIKTKTPEQTEQELMRITPKNQWKDLNEIFVRFGQTVCRPVKPKCPECKINKYCDYYNITKT